MSLEARCDLLSRFCVIGGGKWCRMPSDVVTFAVSTGLGVSVLAGIISGVCYVLAHGIGRRSNRKPKEWYCDVCGTYLRSIDGILEGDKVVTCTKCKGSVCKRRCSSLTKQEGWTCRSCFRPSDSWFQGILNAIQPSNKVNRTRMNADSFNEIDEDLEAIRKKEKEQVRDFIERLVNVMLGENVDDASVTKLYNDTHYDAIFDRYHQDLSNALTDLGSALHISIASKLDGDGCHNIDEAAATVVAGFPLNQAKSEGIKMFFTVFVSVVVTLWILFCAALYTFHYVVEVVLDLPITGQSPCTAHAALKQLVERLLRETVNLPNLQKAQENPPSDKSNRTYEDLLATAIINKVITSCQNNLPSSSAASVSSRVSNSSRNQDKEYFFGEETIENKWKTTDPDSSSMSSLEEWLQSDSSFGSKKYVDRVTLTIKQDIEEVTQSESEDEEDDTEYFRSTSLLNDDESNWFLQKKQFQGTHSPVPVPMLVPNPTTEAKVLIGDKEVDDTSDLSDIASDYEDTDPVPGRQSLIVESKTVIGGKNPLHNGGSESESSGDSGVKEVGSRDRSGYDGPIFVSKTDITVDDDNVEDASILSVYSNTEKEAEYTERYGSLPRTIVKVPAPTPPSRPSLQKAEIPESTKPKGAVTEPDTGKSNGTNDDEEEQRKIKEFTGRYSKREKEKWKHAIEMKNNPYSKENIEKRIQRSHSAASSLFGPDYYARQASSPSGGKASPSEAREVIWPPPKPKEETLYKAVPVVVAHEEAPISPEIKYQTPIVVEVAEQESSELTSDSDLSYINFYDVENSQIYKKSTNSEQVTLIEAKLLPEEPLIEIQEKSDMNGNLASEKDKHPSEADAPVPSERKILSKGKVEDKPNFVKATPTVRQRTLTGKPDNARALKRAKSETDLLDDSFDKRPTVLGKKKDNTLISKIYLDPTVRNFALHNRNQLPVKDVETSKPPLRNQHSIDANVFALATSNEPKKNVYNSDDGITLNHNRKKSYYSSEEDLSLHETAPSFRGFHNSHVRSSRLSSRPSVSSEDGLLSDSSTTLEKPCKAKSTRSFIYSSSEDLLSIDETEKVHKKKDNTLISKIYQDPNVRNFALTNREYMPVPEEEIPPLTPKTPKPFHSSHEDLLLSDHSINQFADVEKTVRESNGASISSSISMDSLRIEETPKHGREEPVYERKMTTPDPDIDELARKKIVHNILGQFQPNQSKVQIVSRPRERKISTDSEEVSISVKDLKKRFENNDAKNKVVSSLTARSLSRQMRETLKN
ncbi:hypothetical protein NQ315_017097 [Exocentrus adspersus]|uniref:Uncharacterized protein n=1 Tax=Exocentrus adspersus TaxID=1586481 RepID=A0AAV8VGM8_9CUCU|nr:hypothetical protein NQ315_017097 [Exocentrus adspersus]